MAWLLDITIFFCTSILFSRLSSTETCPEVQNAIVGIWIYNYTNYEGRLADGTCCNGSPGLMPCPPDNCNIMFKICGRRDGSEPSTCDIFPEDLFSSAIMYGNNSFGFPRPDLKIGNGLTNATVFTPSKIPFRKEVITFKIGVFGTSDTKNLTSSISNWTFEVNWTDPMFQSRDLALYRDFFFKDNYSELGLKVLSQCLKQHYGPSCSICCTPTSQFNCLENGTKNCTEGWMGSSCSEMVDHCPGNKCSNGSSCNNTFTGYSCVCPPSSKGCLNITTTEMTTAAAFTTASVASTTKTQSTVSTSTTIKTTSTASTPKTSSTRLSSSPIMSSLSPSSNSSTLKVPVATNLAATVVDKEYIKDGDNLIPTVAGSIGALCLLVSTAVIVWRYRVYKLRQNTKNKLSESPSVAESNPCATPDNNVTAPQTDKAIGNVEGDKHQTSFKQPYVSPYAMRPPDGKSNQALFENSTQISSHKDMPVTDLKTINATQVQDTYKSPYAWSKPDFNSKQGLEENSIPISSEQGISELNNKNLSEQDFFKENYKSPYAFSPLAVKQLNHQGHNSEKNSEKSPTNTGLNSRHKKMLYQSPYSVKGDTKTKTPGITDRSEKSGQQPAPSKSTEAASSPQKPKVFRTKVSPGSDYQSPYKFVPHRR